ncbi:MAG: hypothetical protein AAB546_03100 [Patescibacteria group bacterium]
MNTNKLANRLFLTICTLLSLFFSISGFLSTKDNIGLLSQFLFLPVTIYFILTFLNKLFSKDSQEAPRNPLVYYNFILVTIMIIGGFISSKTIPQLISTIIFYPLFAYFFIQIAPRQRKTIKPIILKPIISATQIEPQTKKGIDIDRRAFLKIIGSAGLSLFFLTIFTKKTQAAFFGSVPGPGTVAVKDTLGVAIDPAEKHPTDGYEITQVDDSTPSYYGYLNKSGAWFITREEASGAYRYTKGTSDFATNWTNRASLTYDYFDNIF